MVVEHPDTPPNVGGRPKKSLEISSDDEALINRLDGLLAGAGKHENAVNDLIEMTGASRATVFRAMEKRKQLVQQAANAMSSFEELKKRNTRRLIALSQLRRGPG